MKQPVEPQLFNFPLPSTPFVGRSEEVEEITRLLSDSDCQLLTLVGPGGIGKTRLAIQAALKLSGKFFGGYILFPFNRFRMLICWRPQSLTRSIWACPVRKIRLFSCPIFCVIKTSCWYWTTLNSC